VIAIVDLVGITDLATFETTNHPWAAPLTAAFVGCPAPVGGQPRCPADLLARASVAPYVDGSDPPIFMVYGALDQLVVPATQGGPLAKLWLDAHHGDQRAAIYDVLPDADHNVDAHVDKARLGEFLDRSAGGGTLTKRRVILYGDSLASEAQESFRAALGAAGVGDIVTETFGGTAICDWLGQMHTDQAQRHPDAVVVEFSGNAFTPCMKGAGSAPLSSDAYFQKYSDDAREVLRTFSPDATEVYFAGAPISLRAEQSHDPEAGRLNAIYAALAASQPRAHFIDAGLSVSDHGHWTKTLPCLPHETCDGGADASGRRVNVVRAADGMHFCPGAPDAANGITGTCAGWSSGAYRYGVAMADPIPRDLA
jgi:hypothetical protein